MELVGAQEFRERLSKITAGIETVGRDVSTLEHTISISKRKKGMLSKDVSDLRRRREEQESALNKEENKIYALARQLSSIEDQILQMEVELAEVQALNAKIEEEIQSRTECVKEHELVLELYKGCHAI
ncbi:hypothetical protein NECID01_0399 [Nematocida sp. AWRm77]|nr:hypothetical protein NECID01_0399 [Nematocida sp. AWRm77]